MTRVYKLESGFAAICGCSPLCLCDAVLPGLGGSPVCGCLRVLGCPKGAARIGCSPDDVFADYKKASGHALDPDALDLVCVGSLAQMGFRFALGAFASGPDLPEVAARQLEWWAGRAAAALDRIGSI